MYLIPILEISLLSKVHYVHKNCGGHIFGEGERYEGQCQKCPEKLYKIPAEQLETWFMYILPTGQPYLTPIGIFNRN